MKIFITGGTGFIGTQVCKKLIHQGHEVGFIYMDKIKASTWPAVTRCIVFFISL